MSGNEQNQFADSLKDFFEISEVTRALTEPLRVSVERLLETTARELFSQEASVLVPDSATGELRFLAAVGTVADKLAEVRIPRGKGIAGFVFSSGQPMVVADAGDEESFYSEVDKTTGFSTETVLATPLRSDGEVIGVLEYVNRVEGAPENAFSAEEMDRAAFFADLISPVVRACMLNEVVGGMGQVVLRSEKRSEYERLSEWIDGISASDEHRELLKLALLVRDVAGRGESERRMAMEILESIKRYSAELGSF